MFASRFNNDYKKAQHVIECLKFIQQEYDNFQIRYKETRNISYNAII